MKNDKLNSRNFLNEKNDIKKHIEVELYRDNGEILTPWQIQDFISKLANNYYKLDLINNISKRINSGVDKEKFIIMNESFNYKNNYGFLKESNLLDLNNLSEFKHFYHFGKPIPMFPMEDIYKLNLKFSLFSELNYYLGQKNFKKISKDDFHKVVFEDTQDYSEIFKLLKINNLKIDEKEKVRIREDINNKFDKYKEELNKFNLDKEKINIVKELIKNNNYTELEKYEDIERKYFKTFTDTLSRLERPIVGIYDIEKRSVEILGSSFISKKTRDERFLDLKEISHNSPTFVHMFIGISFALPILIMMKNIASTKKNSKNGDLIDKQVEFKINEIINNNNKFDESMKELENILEEEDLYAHESIEDNFYKQNISQLYNDIVNKSVENFNEYGFENKELSSKIIKFEDINNNKSKNNKHLK